MEVLEQTNLYSYDFLKLLRFFDKAELIKKLNGFIKFTSEQGKKNNTRSTLYQIKELIRILSYDPESGIFILENQKFIYLSMDPALTI